MSLTGKTVLITGASGGIGQCIAKRFASHHAHLLLVGRDEAGLHAVRDAVIAKGGNAEVVLADLLDPASRAQVAERCNALSGGLYGLVNNAGCNHFALLGDQTEAMLQAQVNLNLLVPMLLTRSLLPALKREQGARILNIGSTFGSIGYPAYSAYCASKFGLRGFTEALRRELADTDMHVLYLAPRATATRLNSDSVVAMNHELGNGMDEPAVVADSAVKIFISARPAQVFIGWPEKLFARINQIFPGIVDGALLKQLPVIKRYASK